MYVFPNVLRKDSFVCAVVRMMMTFSYRLLHTCVEAIYTVKF